MITTLRCTAHGRGVMAIMMGNFDGLIVGTDVSALPWPSLFVVAVVPVVPILHGEVGKVANICRQPPVQRCDRPLANQGTLIVQLISESPGHRTKEVRDCH